MTHKKLYSAKEVSELLGVKLNQVLYWFRTNKIATIKVGIRYFTTDEAIKDLIGASDVEK